MKILELTEEEAGKLFSVSSWPTAFMYEYEKSCTFREDAPIAARLLRLLADTGVFKEEDGRGK